MDILDTSVSEYSFSLSEFVMKSGLLFSRFFIPLVGTKDFQTIGIKLSLKITNKCRDNLLCLHAFALEILLLQTFNLCVLQGMI